MCGIAGWLGQGLPPGSAGRMLALLRHRGPDEEKTVSCDDGLLMSARLRVMDPSPKAQQPFTDEAGETITVCNGELYNFRELATQLSGRGHNFHTRCDAEVIPHLYEEFGDDFPRHLRGMFAVAVLDTRRHRLVLARDRWGIKPLYYARARGASGEYLVFSSELNSLLASGIRQQPNRQAVSDFAALGYVPSPETFYENVYSLEPGETLDVELDSGRLTWRRSFYHRWTVAPNPALDMSTAVKKTERLLEGSVVAQSGADVPVGILLSGGIDSSLVAAMRSRQDQEVRTFGMRFTDSDYDESWAAKLTAEHLGLRHTVVDLPRRHGTLDHISRLLLAMGQPYSDTSLFAVHALAERVREHVTVCLGGEGGDEAFGGYEVFSDFAAVEGSVTGAPAPASVAALWTAVENRHRLLDSRTHRELCVDTGTLPVGRFFEPRWDYAWEGNPSEAERLVAYTTEAETRLILADDYLVKVDMASMAYGLELRVPILDEELFSFALTLPRALKATLTQTKLVLRNLASQQLPKAVADKPKWGFAVPPYEWLSPNARGEMSELLMAPDSGLPEFFDPRTYETWVAAFQRGETVPGVHDLDLFDRVVMLLSLELHLCALRTASRHGGVALPM